MHFITLKVLWNQWLGRYEANVWVGNESLFTGWERREIFDGKQ